MTAATSPSSGTSAVVDASVEIRALVDRDPAAEAWLAAPAWPSLAYVEIAHVLARLCRNHVIGAEHAERILDAVSVLNADVRPVEALVGRALPLALERGASGTTPATSPLPKRSTFDWSPPTGNSPARPQMQS